MHNKVKRIVAVLLALTLVVTSFVFFDMTALFPTAKATDYDVKIGVPETVYINPQSTKVVEYYINNDIDLDGSYNLSYKLTRGLIYLYSTVVQSVLSVTVDGAIFSYLRAFDDFSTSLKCSSFTFTLDSDLPQNSTRLLEWTITCLMTDGTTQVFHAFTVAYSPNRNVTATGVTGSDCNDNHSVQASGLIYIQGAHKTAVADSGYMYDSSSFNKKMYQNVSGAYYLDPLVGGVASPSDTAPHEFGSEFSKFTGACQSVLCDNCVETDKTIGNGQWLLHMASNLTPAEVYVDKSRYSNTSQLPYLKLRFMVTDLTGVRGRKHWYVSDATSIITNGETPSNASLYYDDVNLLWHSWWRKDAKCKGAWAVCGDILSSSDGNSVTTEGDCSFSCGEKYNETIRSSLPMIVNTSKTLYFRFGVCGARESSFNGKGTWAMSAGFVLLKITAVNKSGLRNLIQDCNKYTVTVEHIVLS